MTQEALRCHPDVRLARGLLSQIERGAYLPLPGSAHARRLEKFFGLTIEELLEEIDPAKLFTLAGSRSGSSS
jgi:hypothetical protein